MIQAVERRLKGLVGERVVRFIEFCGVGASGVVVDLAVTTTALNVTHYLLANVMGFLVAVTWNFAGNWLFVFDRPEGSIPRQYASYVLLHTATFGVRAAVLTALIEAGGVPVLPATTVGIAAAAVANYLGTERILEDGLEWLDAVAAVNSLAHVFYHSRLRRILRDAGLYSPLYGAYTRLLAIIYREETLTVSAGDASAELYTEQPPEVVSIMHTLEKEGTVLERFVDALDEDAVVWDVGANLGVYATLAADVADEVVAVEPVPATAERCAANLSRNGVDDPTVVYGALADQTGHVTLALERAELGTQTPTLDEQQVDRRDELTVPTIQGDALVTEHYLPAPDVLKIDVEGAECAVLDGLTDTLPEVQYAIVEIHPGVDGVAARLEAAGLTVERVSHGDQSYCIGRRP